MLMTTNYLYENDQMHLPFFQQNFKQTYENTTYQKVLYSLAAA